MRRIVKACGESGDVTELEAEVNERVYRLFGLARERIALFEEPQLCRMTEADALALAATGQDVLSQALEDPLAVQIRFDMARFEEVVDFAFGGGFKINR